MAETPAPVRVASRVKDSAGQESFTMARVLTGALVSGAFLLAYIAFDQFDHIGPTRDWPVAPWNPELGLCVAAALRWPNRIYPLILLAPVIDDLVLPGTYAADDGLWTGLVTLFETWAIVVSGKMLSVSAPRLFNKGLVGVLLACLPCALLAAAAGAERLSILREIPAADFAVITARLWVGDVIGVFIILPLLQIDFHPSIFRTTFRRALEIVAQALIVGATVWLAFGEHASTASRYFYGVFPSMIWIVLRSGLRGAIIMNAFVQASLIVALSFSGNDDVDVTLFQALLLVFASSSLTLGLVVDQNKLATAQLHAREEELAASLKVAATGELAGTLAHELGHPLGAISNYAAALNHLVRKLAPDDEALRIGAKLTQEIVRATDTLHRLRDFFRTGSMSLEPVDLGALMKDAIRLLRDRLERNGIAPLMVIPNEPVMVLADQIQLRAVIYNLLVNAIDALRPIAPEDRILSITVRRIGETALLEVEDSGGGVASDVKDHIFEPLITTKKDGLGLGLSMSRSVVNAHGGSITLEGSILGGAKFVISLPHEGV